MVHPFIHYRVLSSPRNTTRISATLLGWTVPHDYRPLVYVIGWFHAEIVWYTGPKVVAHPSTNRARGRVTKFKRRTTVTSAPACSVFNYFCRRQRRYLAREPDAFCDSASGRSSSSSSSSSGGGGGGGSGG